MAALTVHTVPGSPYARAVMATLAEKGVGWKVAGLTPGSLKMPAHLARHPFGKMPVLEHGDFWLYETQAILRYLDRVLAAPALTPADPRSAGQMDQAMNVNDWYLFQGVCNIIGFQRVVKPRVMGLPPDETAIESAIPRARMVFSVLARLLGEQPYFAGDAVSLADLSIAPQLDFFTGLPEWPVLFGPHANLVAWLARMTARPSMKATTWERVADMAKAA